MLRRGGACEVLIHREVKIKKCAGCEGHNIVDDERAGDEVCPPLPSREQHSLKRAAESSYETTPPSSLSARVVVANLVNTMVNSRGVYCQGQFSALFFRGKPLNPFELFPLRSAANPAGVPRS